MGYRLIYLDSVLTCFAAQERGITTVDYARSFTSRLRELKSDCHCVEHVDRNLVYAGLRNASILLEDLRVRPKMPNVIARTLKGKAVVGVMKMNEGVVPWGLAVTAMSNEVSSLLATSRSPLYHPKR